MTASIDKLLVHAAQGDRVATGRLLMLHDQRLRRRLARRIPVDSRNLLSIDDLLQEIYASAYRRITRLEPRGREAFYNWLTAISDRKLSDAAKALRAAKRSPRREARRIAADRSSSFLGLVRLIDKKNKTPSKIMARQDAAEALQTALAALPEPCRQAVWMRHIEGKPPGEIAQALGRSERAVHQLCYRGLHKLREEMGNRSKYLSDTQ